MIVPLLSSCSSLALVGAWVKGGVINIWPVKPFETVMVIMGYTNKMEFIIVKLLLYVYL